MILTLNNIQKKELEKLKQFVCSNIKGKFRNFDGKLDLLHKFIKQKEVNETRFQLFNKINKKFDWERLIRSLCIFELEKMHGRDIVIQSKINLSIQLPNDNSSILPAHTDCASGDSPFQTNIWIPLTDTFKSNSMFIFNEKQSLDYYKNIAKKKSNNIKLRKINNKFVELKYGQILMFNPALVHGNVINKTNKTRVSLNIRAKSLFSPEPSDRNPDRRFGTYYKKFQISDDTKFAINIMRMNFFS